MAVDIVQEVLRGRVENVPSLTYDVVRLYICSTFTDMSTERNYLMKHVYPKLYQYCQENYALQFHPVDLRVGVKALESDDYDTLQLCLDEVKLCQSLSVGPNFVLLLGQKYGTVMLPKRIPEDEFVVMRKSMQGGERDFIDTWYLKDTNALPAIYVLQPRYSKQGIIWALVEARLRDQLQEAALVCVANQLLTDEQAKKYFHSSLEQEISQGILNNPQAEHQCLLFTRSMNNVNSEHKNAVNYVDIVNDEIDPLAQRQLLDLVDQKLFEKLPAYNIYQYENLEWSDSDEGGINEKDHGEYLKDLAGDLEGAVKKMIDSAVANREMTSQNDMYKECLQHGALVKENSVMFWGRKEEMKQIEDYVNDRLSGYPLVLYGHAGCGKTTVIAKAASMMYKEWAKDKDTTYQIMRFLGKTPATREINPLLKNVVQNIVDILAPDVTLPREFSTLPSAFEELSSLFKSIIKLVPKSKKLVILLDGVDELIKSENAFDLQWLPIKLPLNVKIILSCDDQGFDFIEALKEHGFPISNFVNKPGLTSQLSMALLKHWMICHERSLTPHQWKSIAVTLGRKTHRPLYLRLLLDGLLKWHSYDKTYLRSPPKDVTACIRVLFEKLEETHGSSLVAHAFGLLAVTKYGLSQVEMEDILSLDEEVMQSVWRGKKPFIYRLPSMLWRRLQRDARYLSYGEAQGCRVMFWKHRLFHEATEILFLRSRPVQEAVFLNLIVDYYTGKWATTPKMYTLNGNPKNGTKTNETLALRYVPRQVNMFATKDENQDLVFHFNHRKLSELPAALIALAEIDDFSMESLKRIAKTVIFHYEMMYAYLKSGRAEDYIACVTGHWVLDQIHEQSEEFIKRELYILARYLTDQFKYITENPDSAGPFIASQLILFYGYLPNITRFLDKVDSIGRSTCALVPTSQQGSPSLSLAHCKISNHTYAVVDMVVTDRFIYSLSNKLVAMRYSQSNCKVQYSIYIRVPEQDRFQILTAGKQEWTGKYFPDDESKKHKVTEKILLYAVLQLRPHVYIIDSSNGEVLQIIKLDEINRDLMSQRIMFVHVVGDATSVNHLLCVVMHSGAIIIVDISNKQIVWKDTRGKPLIGSFDSGYRDAVQVLGYFQTTGEIVWLTWTNLDEKFFTKNQLSPCVGISEISKASTEVFTNIAVTGRCEYGRNCDTVHAVLSTNHGSVIYVWKLLKIMHGSDSAVYTEKVLSKKKQSVVTLPTREQLNFIACDRSAYGCEEGRVYVVCGTDSRTFVLGFSEKDTYGTILFAMSAIFDHVVLEQYVFYGVTEGCVAMYEYLEEPFRLYTYGAVDEHQGKVGQLQASDGGYLFVTSHDEGGVYLYRSDILVLMARRTQAEKGTVQMPIGTLQCGYILAAALSIDRRTLSLWDIQTCALKREISFQQTVEQFRLSESETHVAAVTNGGKLMLYTVEHVDDLPAEPILQLQLKSSGGDCWLTTVRSQPGSICIITEVGSITTVNVQTCQILHDSKTKMPADIDDVIIRNDNVYIIYHGRRTFLAVHPVSGQATWELDMDSKTGKSLQKFGDAILDIAEYDDSVYALLTSTQVDSLHLNLLCVKPHSNSIYKILDLSLPRRVQFVCSYGNSKHIVLHHHDTVRIIDMSQNCVKMEEKLAHPQITSDGQYLVGVRDERYVKLYRLEDTTCIGSFKLNTDIDCIAVSADDEYVTAVGHDKKIYAFVIADPKQGVHTLTIKKLPSRSHAPLNALETYREDPRYQTLRDMTQVLDEGFPQMLEIDAEEVKNEPLLEKPDSPVRIAPVTSSQMTPGPAYRPRVLSYGTANLQHSTAHRLQKVKNRFIEVDLTTPTPGRKSSPVRNGTGRERHRQLLNMMNRAASAKSTKSSFSTATNLMSSPSKSRLSLVSAKNVQISLRNGAVSPTKSLSLSMSRSRPTSTMSKTCVIS